MAKAKEESTNLRRLNVNFSVELYERLEELAKKNGISFSDLMRRAANRELWIDKTFVEEGARMLVERDGQVREVVFLN